MTRLLLSLVMLFFTQQLVAWQAVEPTPVEIPPILLADEPSTDSWRAVRLRLSHHPSLLRSAIRSTNESAHVDQRIDETLADLDLLGERAAEVAPETLESLKKHLDKARRQLSLLAVDHEARDLRQAGVTLQLFEGTLADMELICARADVEAGRHANEEQALLPPGWSSPKYEDRPSRARLTMLNARELVRVIHEESDGLDRLKHDDMQDLGFQSAIRIGEVGRALLHRQGELHVSSRLGFRNAALRVEVIADNMADFARERDRGNFRRQLIALHEAVKQLQDYLAVGLSEPASLDGG